MTPEERTRISKRMSWALRHAPREAGITLDEAGWVSVRELVEALSEAGLTVDAEAIAEVVALSDKQRFALSEDGTRVCARQGHSVAVELGLAPSVPPARLFHGTVDRFVGAILREGLRRGQRHHVHLSASREVAEQVGRRRGRPVVLAVAAAAMAKLGHQFFCTDNGVWLVDAVPPEHVEVLE